MNQAAAYALDELRKPAPAVRADVLCVLDRVVRDLPAHWSRRKGAPQLMVFLDGHGDARTERTGLCEPARHGFLDEFHRRVRGGRRKRRRRTAAPPWCTATVST